MSRKGTNCVREGYLLGQEGGDSVRTVHMLVKVKKKKSVEFGLLILSDNR